MPALPIEERRFGSGEIRMRFRAPRSAGLFAVPCFALISAGSWAWAQGTPDLSKSQAPTEPPAASASGSSAALPPPPSSAGEEKTSLPEPAGAEAPKKEENKSKKLTAPSKAIESWDNSEPSPAAISYGRPLPPKPEKAHFPVAYAARPLTFPKGMIAPELSFLLYKQPLLYRSVDSNLGGESIFSEPRLSLRIGVTDNFQFDVNVLSFQMSPELVYTNPELALTFRFARGTMDAGFRVHSILPLQNRTSPALGMAFPFVFHLGRVRLDTGLQMMLIFDRYGEIRSDIVPPMFGEIRDGRLEAGLPIEVNINVADFMSLGANTGVMVPLPEKANIIYFPLGFRANFTIIQTDRPIVDIDTRFELPLLMSMGSEGAGVDEAFYFGFTIKTFFML